MQSQKEDGSDIQMSSTWRDNALWYFRFSCLQALSKRSFFALYSNNNRTAYWLEINCHFIVNCWNNFIIDSVNFLFSGVPRLFSILSIISMNVFIDISGCKKSTETCLTLKHTGGVALTLQLKVVSGFVVSLCAISLPHWMIWHIPRVKVYNKYWVVRYCFRFSSYSPDTKLVDHSRHRNDSEIMDVD